MDDWKKRIVPGLHLLPSEEKKRNEFLKKEGHSRLADLEETCDGSASYWYEVHTSGIGDTIIVHYNGKSCDITDYDVM